MACRNSEFCHTVGGNRQQYRLLDIDGWQGALDVLCQKCWNKTAAEDEKVIDERSWTVLCTKLWRKRTATAESINRGIKLKEARLENARLPGESARAWHKRVIHDGIRMIKTFVKDVMDLPEEEQKEIELGLDLMQQEIERIAQDPTYASSMECCGNILDEDAAQFCSEITAHISEYFLCRAGADQTPDYKNCGYFGPAQNWIGTDPTGTKGCCLIVLSFRRETSDCSKISDVVIR